MKSSLRDGQIWVAIILQKSWTVAIDQSESSVQESRAVNRNHVPMYLFLFVSGKPFSALWTDWH